MKKLFCLVLALYLLFCFCSCRPDEENGDVVRIRLECGDRKERDRTIREITDLISDVESAEECRRRLLSAGYEITEEYFEMTRCEDRVFRAGYYPTCRVGQGENGYQFIAYPSYVYQSLEKYNNARYGSFFYKIKKKMEERD